MTEIILIGWAMILLAIWGLVHYVCKKSQEITLLDAMSKIGKK